MKNQNKIQSVLFAVLLTTSGVAYGQGQVEFSNFLGNKVFNQDMITPLSGGSFTAVLMASVDGIQPYVQVAGPVPFESGGNAGYFLSGGTFTTLPSSAPAFPTFGSYFFKVMASGNSLTGESAPFRLTPGNNPFNNPDLAGSTTTSPASELMPSFFLVVPEPSVVALALIGSAGLLLRRRK